MPHLGPFRLLHLAGHGGQGVVYAATHENGTLAAVKVVHRRSSTAALHELRMTAALRHPHVVEVFDWGEVPESIAGWPPKSVWIATEWASGGTLAGHRPTTWSAVRRGIEGVLSALIWIHARSLLHRDIKPTNVLLAGPEDLRGGWKLADFGIAWTRDADVDARLGSPNYMAPEQLLHGHLGPWTDLWGVGATIWELLNGQPAFIGAGASLADAILTREPGCHQCGFCPTIDVPDGVEDWLRRLLQKDSTRRFRYATEALEALPTENAAVRPAVRSVWPELGLNAADTVIATTVWDVGTRPTVGDAEVKRDDAPAPLRAPPQDPPSEPITPPRLYLPGVGAKLIGLIGARLIGRTGERRQLWDALRRCADAGQPRRVALVGPEGAGRRCLASWLAEAAHAAGVSEYARLTYQGTASDGLTGLVRRWFGPGGVTPTVDGVDIGALVAAWLDGARPDARLEIWYALAEAIDAAGGRHVFIIEDASLADDFFAFWRWAKQTRPRGWLTLEVHPTAPAGMDGAAVEVVPVGPLPSDELVSLALNLGLSPIAAARVADGSHGSPGDLVARCVRTTQSGGWTVTAQGLDFAIDADGLDQDSGAATPTPTAAVLLAGVMGPSVNVREWQGACEQLGLDPLAAWQQLPEETLIATSADEWRFRDPREPARWLATERPPSAVFAAAADAIRTPGPAAAVRRARHRIAAEQLALARPDLLAAAEAAITTMDMPTIDVLVGLLEAAAEGDAYTVACAQFCRAQLATWRGQAAEALYLDAERFAESAPDWVVRSLHARIFLPGVGAGSAAARVLAERALALARERSTPRVLGEAELTLAKVLCLTAPHAALVHADAAATRATTLGDDRLLGAALTAAATSAAALGDLDLGDQRLRRALEAAERSGSRSLRGVVRCELAQVAKAKGALTEALALAEAGAADLRRIRHPAHPIAEANAAGIELALGRSEAARRRVIAALGTARASSPNCVPIVLLCLLAWDAQDGDEQRWDDRWAEAHGLLVSVKTDEYSATYARAAATAADAAGWRDRAAAARALAGRLAPQ
jgi:hypothetical protein